jgi:hypothetical protein
MIQTMAYSQVENKKKKKYLAWIFLSFIVKIEREKTVCGASCMIRWVLVVHEIQ